MLLIPFRLASPMFLSSLRYTVEDADRLAVRDADARVSLRDAEVTLTYHSGESYSWRVLGYSENSGYPQWYQLAPDGSLHSNNPGSPQWFLLAPDGSVRDCRDGPSLLYVLATYTTRLEEGWLGKKCRVEDLLDRSCLGEGSPLPGD